MTNVLMVGWLGYLPWIGIGEVGGSPPFSENQDNRASQTCMTYRAYPHDPVIFLGVIQNDLSASC